jgi:hypothetical protein
LKALAAALQVLRGEKPSVPEAAKSAGTNPAYVAAALSILKSTTSLAVVGDVLWGAESLIPAAVKVAHADEAAALRERVRKLEIDLAWSDAEQASLRERVEWLQTENGFLAANCNRETAVA